MQALLILEGALCILTAPARLQPPVRDPPAAQTHGVAAGHMGWSWGRGNLPEWQSLPQLRGLALLEDWEPRDRGRSGKGP